MNSKTKRANNQVNSVMNIQEQREMVEKEPVYSVK